MFSYLLALQEGRTFRKKYEQKNVSQPIFEYMKSKNQKIQLNPNYFKPVFKLLWCNFGEKKDADVLLFP